MTARTSGIVQLLIVGCALVLGLMFTLQTMPEVFITQHPHAFSEDDHYHLRRVRYALKNPGKSLEFDRYMSFPKGAYSWWPDGFDGLLAGANRAVIGEHGTRAETTVFTTLMIPLLGLLCLPLVFWLGRRLYGPWIGALATLLAAVLPSRVATSVAGLVDHHCIEPVLSLLPLLLLAAALRANKRTVAGWAAAAGLCLGGSLYFWGGGLMIIGVTCAALLLALWGRARCEWPKLIALVLPFVTLLVLTTWAAVASTPLGRAGSYQTHIISRFHLLFVATLAGQVLLWAAVGWATSNKARRGLWQFAGFTAINLAVGALVFVVGREAIDSAINAARFLTSPGVVAWIQEVAPMWQRWHDGPVYFSYLAPFVIGLGVYEGLRCWRKRAEMNDALMFHAAGMAFLLLAVLQFRHKTHYTAFFAVLSIELFARCYRWVLARLSAQQREKHKRALGLGVAAAGIALFTVPMTAAATMGLGGESRALQLAACDWLRIYTPQASKPFKDGEPQYSVAGPWGIGKTISSVADRPSIGSADALGEQFAGVRDLVSLWSSHDTQYAASIFDRYRVRYAMLPPEGPRAWQMRASVLGVPASKFLSGPNKMRPETYRNILLRLYWNNGSAQRGSTASAMRRWRLVYQTPGRKAGLATKIFERTQGNQLVVNTTANAQIIVQAQVRLPDGQKIVYQDLAHADHTGRATIRFPYCEGSRNNNAAWLEGPVLVKTPNALLQAKVKHCDRNDKIQLVKASQ